jgi:peptidoglycan/xylan/chitin deacetylase (PgdA/CDA1 family)
MKGFKAFVTSSLLAGVASAHPQHSKRTLPLGTVIYSCTVSGTVALTFDDGPYIYTDALLTALEAGGHRATFFQNGQNYDNIYSYNTTIQRMIAGNHQVCSHTWSHADLTTLTDAGIAKEMQELEVAFTNIIGKIPTYMRPVSCIYFWMIHV